MERLSEGDLRNLLTAAGILARDVDYRTFPKRAVEAIYAVLDVDFVSYNEVDSAAGTSRFLLKPDPGEFVPGSKDYAAYVRRFGNHPMIAQKVAAAGRKDPGLQQFVDRLRFLGMVGNCCGQGELRLNMGLSVSKARSRRIGIAVNRSLRDFDDRDAALLAALSPYVQAAYRNSLSADVLRHEPAAILRGDIRGMESLTARESEVLYWVSMGKTNDEVGDIVGAKPMTIKKHLEHIYDKLGVPNRTAAARYAAAERQPA
jgi:DNA-binding CsgD family transcriptional regulator